MESQTDWTRLNAMDDGYLTENARRDPDNPEWTEEAWKRMESQPDRKKRDVHLKLDEDIVRWFKSFGRGYQARINAVLRAFVKRNQAPILCFFERTSTVTVNSPSNE